MMDIKRIFEMDLRGHDYLRARGLTPQTAMQGQREDRRLTDKLPVIIQITENFRTVDELRFVGAI